MLRGGCRGDGCNKLLIILVKPSKLGRKKISEVRDFCHPIKSLPYLGIVLVFLVALPGTAELAFLFPRVALYVSNSISLAGEEIQLMVHAQAGTFAP